MKDVSAFKLDISDLLYTVPMVGLLSSVSKCVVGNDEIGFRNETGVSVKYFMELLTLYLNSLLA